jgi:hypothetical protein
MHGEICACVQLRRAAWRRAAEPYTAGAAIFSGRRLFWRKIGIMFGLVRA